MRAVRPWLLIAAVTFAAIAQAGQETVTFGLRFVVDAALAATPDQRLRTETRLARYVEELNGYYRDSEVVLRAKLVDVSFAAFDGDDTMQLLEAMTNERGAFSGLFSRADSLGADYTVAISNHLMLRDKRGCGRGIAVNKTVEELVAPKRRVAVIDFACGSHTLAHELGHLMGLNHGYMVALCQPNAGHTTAIAPYANGYAVGPCDGKPGAAKFGTIMVGGWMREIKGDQKSLPMFSNPRIHDPRCGESGVCGDPEIGDEARALNENARYYSLYKKP